MTVAVQIQKSSCIACHERLCITREVRVRFCSWSGMC